MMECASCPGCAAAALEPVGDGTRAALCGACKGLFVEGEALTEVVGARVPLAPATVALDGPEPPRCPDDGGVLAERWPFGREELAVASCSVCGGTWMPPGRVALLRAEAARRAPDAPIRPPRAEAPCASEPEARIDRVAFDQPVVDLLALPLAFAMAILATGTELGRLLVFPMQIAFHEVGHAIPSWLSSRAALPLPCGITFTREEPTLFAGASFVFLLAVLAYAGHRERRPYAVVVAASLFVAWAFFTFVLDAERTRELVLLGGIAGELWLSGFVVASFYFPAPDRLRWDFFRVVLLPIGCMSFVGTTRLWIAIAADRAELPLGSLFGAHGDGSGDLDRLIAELGWTQGGLVHLYLALAAVVAFALFTLYLVFGARALARMR